MNGTSLKLKLTLTLAATLAATIGCTTKTYVRQQTTPLINKTNELDDMTAKNSRDIKDVDQRAHGPHRQLGDLHVEHHSVPGHHLRHNTERYMGAASD